MAFNVLLVDDSRVTRKMIGRTLQTAGLPIRSVYEAANGLAGLQQMRANHIDLVIADINMPVMSGVEMIQSMRSDRQLSKIPVVVVSIEGAAGRHDELRSLGVCAYVRKPFRPEEIGETLKGVLGELGDETEQRVA